VPTPSDALITVLAPDQAGTVLILRHLARAVGVPFDPTRATQAVRAAER
jgi:hypothetical protein